MQRREAAQLEEYMCYWQPQSDQYGKMRFRHAVIGGYRDEIGYEPRGGIIADEMGLGKTLTTLALIVSSLSQSLNFVQQSQSISEIPLRATRATLVVVPSIRAFLLSNTIRKR